MNEEKEVMIRQIEEGDTKGGIIIRINLRSLWRFKRSGGKEHELLAMCSKRGKLGNR